MSEKVNGSQGAGDRDAYSNSWEHLADELARLDLLLLRQVQSESGRYLAGPLEQFQGLVLSEEEIVGLLTPTRVDAPPNDAPSGAPKRQELANEALKRIDARIRERVKASIANNVYLALPVLSQMFRLTQFEERCVLVCLAPEVDRKYEKIYAFLQDDVTRRRPSVDLTLNLVCSDLSQKVAARDAFEGDAPLRKFRLLQMSQSAREEAIPLLSRFLKLDDRIVGFLLGSGQIAPDLEAVARIVSTEPDAKEQPVEDQVLYRLAAFVKSRFESSSRQRVVLHLRGRHGSGRFALAKRICRELGLGLLVTDPRKMLAGTAPFEELSWLLGREAALQPVAIGIEEFDRLLADDDQTQLRLANLMEAIQTFSPLTILLGTEPWDPAGLKKEESFISLECPTPDISQRKELWEQYLAPFDHVCTPENFVELAGKFRFTAGQIRESVVRAKQLSQWRANGDAKITMEDIHQACSAQAGKRLGTLAQQIKPVFGWEDIILPKDQMQQLRELAHHVRREQVVMGDWGFAAKLPRGRGLTTLFSGPSGTGKTMAAEVLAKELGLDLFKIDLSGVVSKYIGETEKNLNRIFTEAEDSNAILFFDEADALFGKRTEVKDAHDRYANIEVSYLLQKMEEYRGVVILATNLRKNMDEAFVRRMRFIVDFPFPDEVQREKIWAGVFPDQAPIDPGVDYRFLGRRLSLTGGNIRNISIRAAFLAAAKDQENPQIEMEEVIAATKREFQKMGRLHSDEDFHPFGRGVSKRAPQKDSTADQESPTEDRSKPE